MPPHHTRVFCLRTAVPSLLTPSVVLRPQLAKNTPTNRNPTNGALCNFGNSSLGETAAAWPQGGPARALKPSSGNGSLPWHVPATIVNASTALCYSPALDAAVNSSFTHVSVEVRSATCALYLCVERAMLQ